ncbi:hypothetical protein [Leptolyngbya sp. FACHB-261]|uniref:hypothetical protein n=1 Tax=Leptolyngbya sp. FACHB-261 TaxID=2692806 RepID=UPI001683897B|nr:hypothetical protein [Leptolyngbya sp. FACHB-261]MBD2099311.1 hypothetical protein [Leptolyngbya sp. FACHB-261]
MDLLKKLTLATVFSLALVPTAQAEIGPSDAQHSVRNLEAAQRSHNATVTTQAVERTQVLEKGLTNEATSQTTSQTSGSQAQTEQRAQWPQFNR